MLGVAIVDRIWGFWQLRELQIGYLLGGAFGLGFIAAAVWTYVTRPNSLEAAIELDKRYQLKERVSSALNLPATEFDTPAGQALIEDAERRIKKVEVSEHFGLKIKPTALLPVVPALIAFLVILLVPVVKLQTADASNSTNANKELKKPNANIKPLIKSVKKKREQAKTAGLKEAERLFEKLEQGTKEISPKEDQKKTLVKLNKLADELKKRAKQLGNAEKLKQQLNNLKNMEKGPADKFGKAMKDGDLNKGLNELKKLQQQLANNELDAKAQKN